MKLILVMVVTILGVHSCSAQAQQMRLSKYLGAEASIGLRSFMLTSGITTIDGLRGCAKGGSLGLMLGNEQVKARFKMGYYFSSDMNPRTQEVLESSGAINFYPLEFFRKREALVHPYLIVGSNRTSIKYTYTYLYNTPYTGEYDPQFKIFQSSVVGGLGIEMRWESDRFFMHFFGEGTLEHIYSRSTQGQIFGKTSTQGITSINLGTSIGFKWLR